MCIFTSLKKLFDGLVQSLVYINGVSATTGLYPQHTSQGIIETGKGATFST